MRILHYSLGFPPYRSGGLTKYCMDLMLSQKESGHEVSMMWPGRFSVSGHFVRFKRGKNHDGINSVEVVNPLPVPLDEGIENAELYTAECPNPNAYAELLKELKPDAIHIHTLMGLHREFLKEAKNLGIRIVFTSHDYFGICPKVTLFKEGAVCDGDCKKCAECNKGALSFKKIKILQSPLYRMMKDSAVVKKIRQKHRQEFFETNEEISEKADENHEIYKEETEKYEKLRKYYVSILEKVDIIHFNSSVTEMAYRKYIPDNIKSKVVNITHRSVSDNRKEKKFEGKLKITYLAPPKPFKGWLILKQTLDELWEEGFKDFELNIYNDIPSASPYMNINGHFEYSQLSEIFEKTDVLIAPSVWYETFGFTVLEALSFGVPVIVSDNVGAKDLLVNSEQVTVNGEDWGDAEDYQKADYGMIIKPTKEAVKSAVKKVLDDRIVLKEFNERIVNGMDLGRVIRSPEEIEKLYVEE